MSVILPAFANVHIIWGRVVCVYNINNNTSKDLEEVPLMLWLSPTFMFAKILQ